MSTWMVTRRNSPILRIGIRSTIRSPRNGHANPTQSLCERVGQSSLGDYVLKLRSKMHDGGSDLRPYAADDAIGAHETGGRDGLQQMLCNERVDGGDARDIDNGYGRAGCDDFLQQALHHHL